LKPLPGAQRPCSEVGDCLYSVVARQTAACRIAAPGGRLFSPSYPLFMLKSLWIMSLKLMQVADIKIFFDDDPESSSAPASFARETRYHSQHPSACHRAGRSASNREGA